MPCTQDDWCPVMGDRLNEGNQRAKGLCPVVVVNTKTNKTRVIGVAYKMSAADKGVMLNNCPWCGCTIQWWEESAEDVPRPKEPAAACGEED